MDHSDAVVAAVSTAGIVACWGVSATMFLKERRRQALDKASLALYRQAGKVRQLQAPPDRSSEILGNENYTWHYNAWVKTGDTRYLQQMTEYVEED